MSDYDFIPGANEVCRAYESLQEGDRMEIVLASLRTPDETLTWTIWTEGGVDTVRGWPLPGSDLACKLSPETFGPWWQRMIKENVAQNYTFGGPALRIHAVSVNGRAAWEAVMP